MIYRNTNVATILTGKEEWYTPSQYVESARKVMGSIDLDPASCKRANEIVRAAKFYTKDDDGTQKPWWGNVWLNPPYAATVMSAYVKHLVEQYAAGAFRQAIFLTHNNLDTEWWIRAYQSGGIMCSTKGRIRFYDAFGESNSPTHGHTFIYFGKRRKAFENEFCQYGPISSLVRGLEKNERQEDKVKRSKRI